MGHTRKRYPPTLKARIVLEILREEKSVSELSSEHGIHPTMLHRWRQQAIENLSAVFASSESWRKEREEYQTRIEELYTEIGRLSTQLSWLKKQGIDVD
jgi:transposase-like protein